MRRAALYGVMLAMIAVLVTLNYYLWQNQQYKKSRIEGLQTQVGFHRSENQALHDRNEALLVEVENLRSPQAYEAYEEKAREEYGMIGQNETYFVLPDSELSGLPDIPGLDGDVVTVINPDQTPDLQLESTTDNSDSIVVPVSPVPLQLESIQE